MLSLLHLVFEGDFKEAPVSDYQLLIDHHLLLISIKGVFLLAPFWRLLTLIEGVSLVP